jgi:septum formation inhibitor MinC
MKINKEAQQVALLHSMVTERLEEFRRAIQTQQVIIDSADLLHEQFGLKLRQLDKVVYDAERDIRYIKVAITNIRGALSTKQGKRKK